MRFQWKVVAFATVGLAFSLGLKPGSSQPRVPPTPSPEIEPSPPVMVDLRLVSVTGTGNGGTASLELVVQSDTPIPELSVDVTLPEGLQVWDGTPTHGWTTGLAAGEQKRHVMQLAAVRNGVFAIRAEISVYLPEGRAFRFGQGATVRFGSPPPEGRLNAGAYEFRGVPIEELQR